MNLTEAIAEIRDTLRDLQQPYFFSDDRIRSALNHAQDEACRRARLLVDSRTPYVCEVDVAAGEPVVELHESVIFVRRARLAGAGVPLVPRVARTMDEQCPGWEDSPPSRPMVFVPDWETGMLRLWPTPAADEVLLLTVIRTPMPHETLQVGASSFLLPRRYHKALLDGALAELYAVPDMDTFNPGAAAAYAEKFSAEFGPPSAAIDEHWAAEQYFDVGNH